MRHLSIAVLAVAASFSLAPLLASADEIDLPARKPGQWQLKIQPAGMPKAIVSQICLDAATDKALMGAALSVSSCQDMKVTHDGADIVIDATCTNRGLTSKSHSVISGDFQSSYTITVQSDRIAGTSPMPPHSSMTQTATWMGECANGLQPGEMLMPNGMKMNLTKALGGG